jgi:hypothetical protein
LGSRAVGGPGIPVAYVVVVVVRRVPA